MESVPQLRARRSSLPLILIAAVVQGLSLYALHRAIEAHQWPATSPAWLLAFYTVAFLAPTTVQLMAEFAERSSLWVLTVLLAAAVFYFGWHYGSSVFDVEAQFFVRNGDPFPLASVLLVWWLLTLPFLQCRVATDQWRVDYERLFAFAWRNVITLAEAVLFTALFWLILLLWKSLFHMLGIDFFRTLFDEPIFVYPVTAIVFGCALHLIGSIDTLISAVLEQVLNVLKWLATVAGALLILFTVALLTKLPGLIVSGRHAIGAVWLLWLVAVIVLFLNAAYRDGKVDRPYPRWISDALRFSMPLTVVIAVTALYALLVRSHHFGLSVERVWGFIVAGAALVYSVGYSIAAFRRGPWLAMASRVNVMVAVALIVVIGAALTPLLSPHRLAANSQYQLILNGRYMVLGHSSTDEPAFLYLATNCGNYGRRALQRLASLQGHPHADQIRDLAAQALKPRYPWQVSLHGDSKAAVAQLPLYPAGRTLDPDLTRRLTADWSRFRPYVPAQSLERSTVGVFVDLDGDGTDEFVLFYGGGGSVYQNQGRHWQYVGEVFPEGAMAAWPTLLKAISGGDITTVAPPWKDLSIGSHLYRVVPGRR